MHYQPIPGTRVGVHTKPKKKDAKVPCVRCGRKREPNSQGSSGLCRDCKDVLSKEEQELWTKQNRAA